MTVGSPGCQGALGAVGEKRNACGISTQSASGGPGGWGEWRLCLTPHSLHCPRASLPGSLVGPLHHETEETWANGRVRGSWQGWCFLHQECRILFHPQRVALAHSGSATGKKSSKAIAAQGNTVRDIVVEA